MELVKFYQTAKPEHIKKMKQLIADKKTQDAWTMLKQHTGTNLK